MLATELATVKADASELPEFTPEMANATASPQPPPAPEWIERMIIDVEGQ